MTENYPFYKWDVFETKHFIFGQDWCCPIPAFFIVEPKRKEIKSLIDMTQEEYADYSKVVLGGRKLMNEAFGIEKVYLFADENAKHFHLWLFPRYEWMGKFGDGVESIKEIRNYAEKNMMGEENIGKVKDAVEKAKQYWGKKNGAKSKNPS